ncbi:hypothetical protein ISN45_Aa03g033600 [Arabidopsis thaliana x Arabidopsis arenosa]|uniref:Non-LTR retroelement reverse transcriptase n=1 Tax=Arabidopsis thaliana x Arabidopsis arenosa TaxID=1240361 RepID=A0A8T2B064_9BRAS|nr:hypothetical protein ISN45_Aa03g033600 [Arabidopsis thaliana x Arabidopsis arenosa]
MMSGGEASGEASGEAILGTSAEDTTMTDIGERVRPPDPPDVGGSWVNKVVGSNAGGRLSPEAVLNEEFVAARVSLDFPDGEDGEPVITIGKEVLDVMNGLWKQCMIVKVLGKNISIAALSRRLRELWKPQGAMHVMDLPRHFFMVRFESEEEYLMALTGGPWRVFGNYLMVQAWSPSFDPLKDDIATTPVWIRLSNIPVNFYHKTILMGIARGLGRPVKVDLTTLNFERARFARVCVEVDLKKPLKGSVVINGERYYVSYEGLSNICSGCGLFWAYGAFMSTSYSRKGECSSCNSGGNCASAGKITIGGWFYGGSTGWPPTRTVAGFGGLDVVDIPPNQSMNCSGSEANKENEIISLASQKGKSISQGKDKGPVLSFEQGRTGPRNGPKEKRIQNSKSLESGPKPKSVRTNQPSRGLVFGPLMEDRVLAASGKRLRVEMGNVGRPGGMVMMTGGGTPETVITGSGSKELEESARPVIADEEMLRVNGSIRYMLKKYTTDLLAIFETHAGGENASRICRGLGFENSYKVDAAGQSGGLWLLWRSEVGIVVIIEATDQFIHAQIDNGGEVTHVIVVYAAPSTNRRSGLWEQLHNTLQGVDSPVIVGGDFNTIVRVDERAGGSGRLSADSLKFGDWINAESLIDMGFKGNKFTWRRGKVQQNFVAKRLDRILCCPHARLKWQEATVSHLPFLASDHAPLYLQLSPRGTCNPSRRPFRFEAAWLSHGSFKELLESSWRRDMTTPEALEVLRVKLKVWNRDVFGNVHNKKENLLAEITSIHEELDQYQTDALLEKEDQLIKELETVLEQEETIWFQKSREKWIALGERNISFFHTSTVIRRRKNRIEALKNDEGQWVSNPEELESLANSYYQKLYSMEDVSQTVPALSHNGFLRLTREEKVKLSNLIVASEIEIAMRSMGAFKSPGPDGYQPVFYQKSWDIVGESVTHFVLQFFESGVLPPGLNDVLLVLIAKVMKPEMITQFRPISLCNVLFKVITKVMVLRLKPVMAKLIGPAQSSFIPGRLSIDNIVVVQEAVHSMKRKKGRKGWMLLKLDLEKAYDRIRWDFLEDTLVAAGLSASWVRWIMQCVTGPSMSILWNGEKTESFKPARGLRQGDPLSPYLFVLCLERLCHMIDEAVIGKTWKPIHLSRGGPPLSHVCFADDLILFAEASVTQIRVLQSILEKFCWASGQKVSLEKSKIFFSENVSRDMQKLISDESGIKATKNLGKYLGMPILQKRLNKETFGEVLERVSSKLAGWKGRCMSLAGRLTLTKAVLNSIPIHTMSIISIPKSLLKELDKVSRSFLWGSTREKKRQHLIAWKRVCLPKSEGGAGIKQAADMNKALLAKVGWRVLQDRTSLWAKVLRCKYKIGDMHNTAWTKPSSNWSSTWRSVAMGIREVVFPGQSWVLGDGKEIKFWKDKWLMHKPLIELVEGELPAERENELVKSLWQDSVGWKLDRITPFTSNDTRLRLGALVVDSVTGAKDRVSWGENSEGKFTVRSAYQLVSRDENPRPDMEKFWARVWRVVAPERVRVFLWLVGNQAVMSNAERFRRHLCDSSICQVCKSGEEDTLHILRDCPAMQGIWTRIIPARLRHTFFSMTLLEWLWGNLSGGIIVESGDWSTLFSMALWWGWKWRCGNVFGGNGKCRDRVRFVKDLAKEVTEAHQSQRQSREKPSRVERQISWTVPLDGWVKVNTDGASHGNPGKATAGGVLRDMTGSWMVGFALHIGVCSAPMAELWGVYYGLYLAWERRATRVEVDVDSEMVVGFLTTGISDAHPLSFLVRLCHGFIARDWIVRISHVYREANRLADGLANYAFSLRLGFHLLESIPSCVASIALDDIRGTAISRQVCI